MSAKHCTVTSRAPGSHTSNAVQTSATRYLGVPSGAGVTFSDTGLGHNASKHRPANSSGPVSVVPKRTGAAFSGYIRYAPAVLTVENGHSFLDAGEGVERMGVCLSSALKHPRVFIHTRKREFKYTNVLLEFADLDIRAFRFYR